MDTATTLAQTAVTTFNSWAAVLVGSWTIQGPSLAEGGSHTVSLTGNGAMQAKCVLNGLDGTWMAVPDASTGKVKQNTVWADGSTDTTYIWLGSGGIWQWSQACIFSNGQTASSSATFTASNGGKTLTQNITKRVLAGVSLPDIQYILTRT